MHAHTHTHTHTHTLTLHAGVTPFSAVSTIMIFMETRNTSIVIIHCTFHQVLLHCLTEQHTDSVTEEEEEEEEKK